MTPYVAGVVKRLTRRIVAPLCVGSSPTTRPIFFYLKTGNEGPWPADSFIWGYRQAVRQRTLTPLSVVRLHLPLPVIKSCSFPLQDFLRGNKSLSRPVASAPFGDWRHHLPPQTVGQSVGGTESFEPSCRRCVQWRSRKGGGERSEPIRRMIILPYDTES
jgi:hypothetical protein